MRNLGQGMWAAQWFEHANPQNSRQAFQTRFQSIWEPEVRILVWKWNRAVSWGANKIKLVKYETSKTKKKGAKWPCKNLGETFQMTGYETPRFETSGSHLLRLSELSECRAPCVYACIKRSRTHVKDSVENVWVRWIMETHGKRMHNSKKYTSI